MQIAIHRNRSTSPNAIREAEQKMGVSLPDDFKNFLLAWNGGKPESNRCDVPKSRAGCSVTLFFGILAEGERGDLLSEQAIFSGRLPHGVIAIALAEGGNLVCISTQPKDFGVVYFWDHEFESEHDKTRALSKLSDVFSIFLDNLCKFDLNKTELQPGQVEKAWIDPDFLKSLKRNRPS